MYASTYVLVSLSLDRLEAIARPLSFSASRSRAPCLIGLSWGLSCIFSVPMLILGQVVPSRGGQQCDIMINKIEHWQIYLSVIAAAVFFIPALIIAVCYYVIIYIIWKKSKSLTAPVPSKASLLQRMSIKGLRNGTIRDHVNRAPDGQKRNHSDCSTSSRGVIPKAKIRTVKMTLVIVIAFVVCWSPFFIFNMLDVFGHVVHSVETRATRILIQSFAPLNSVANPIIYGAFSSKICLKVRKIRCLRWLADKFRCCCCGNGSERRGTPMYSSAVQTFSSTRRSTKTTYLTDKSQMSSVRGGSNRRNKIDINPKQMTTLSFEQKGREIDL